MAVPRGGLGGRVTSAVPRPGPGLLQPPLPLLVSLICVWGCPIRAQGGRPVPTQHRCTGTQGGGGGQPVRNTDDLGEERDWGGAGDSPSLQEAAGWGRTWGCSNICRQEWGLRKHPAQRELFGFPKAFLWERGAAPRGQSRLWVERSWVRRTAARGPRGPSLDLVGTRTAGGRLSGSTERN